MLDAAALAGDYLDLVSAPFTLPRSRVLVFREGDGVRVHTSEYERGLEECRVLDALTVLDAEGRPLGIHDVRPARVYFTGPGGTATLTFSDERTLSVEDHLACVCACGDRTGPSRSICWLTGSRCTSAPTAGSPSAQATTGRHCGRLLLSGMTGSLPALLCAPTCSR